MKKTKIIIPFFCIILIFFSLIFLSSCSKETNDVIKNIDIVCKKKTPYHHFNVTSESPQIKLESGFNFSYNNLYTNPGKNNDSWKQLIEQFNKVYGLQQKLDIEKDVEKIDLLPDLTQNEIGVDWQDKYHLLITLKKTSEYIVEPNTVYNSTNHFFYPNIHPFSLNNNYIIEVPMKWEINIDSFTYISNHFPYSNASIQNIVYFMTSKTIETPTKTTKTIYFPYSSLNDEVLYFSKNTSFSFCIFQREKANEKPQELKKPELVNTEPTSKLKEETINDYIICISPVLDTFSSWEKKLMNFKIKVNNTTKEIRSFFFTSNEQRPLNSYIYSGINNQLDLESNWLLEKYQDSYFKTTLPTVGINVGSFAEEQNHLNWNDNDLISYYEYAISPHFVLRSIFYTFLYYANLISLNLVKQANPITISSIQIKINNIEKKQINSVSKAVNKDNLFLQKGWKLNGIKIENCEIIIKSTLQNKQEEEYEKIKLDTNDIFLPIATIYDAWLGNSTSNVDTKLRSTSSKGIIDSPQNIFFSKINENAYYDIPETEEYKNYGSIPFLILGELNSQNKFAFGNKSNFSISPNHSSEDSFLKSGTKFNSLPLIVFPNDCKYFFLNVIQPSFPNMEYQGVENGIF
ncbi:MAG: hypothetical protein LBF02_01715 [Mycoplasmataceae bacterium]|nr:hypothetical protein [Mycoplasmataceae bacterium]